ncbi:hypothetical protein VPHD529_0022 [Vibrio phage D529]
MNNQEAQARIFAEATHQAREMTPLLTQEFDVRIKNNEESFKHLRTSVPADVAVKLLGKTIRVKVLWGACGGVNEQHFMFLGIVGDICKQILFDESDMKAICTQKGLAPRMFYAWQTANKAAKGK